MFAPTNAAQKQCYPSIYAKYWKKEMKCTPARNILYTFLSCRVFSKHVEHPATQHMPTSCEQFSPVRVKPRSLEPHLQIYQSPTYKSIKTAPTYLSKPHLQIYQSRTYKSIKAAPTNLSKPHLQIYQSRTYKSIKASPTNRYHS